MHEYTEIKRALYNSINNAVTDIEKRFSNTIITNMLKKYEATNLHNLLSILYCTSEVKSNCIDVNLQTHIKEIENELYSMDFKLQLVTNEKKQVEAVKDALIDELKQVKDLVLVYNQRTEELTQLFKYYEMILINNNLDVKKEIKKVQLNHPLKQKTNNSFPKL